MARFSKSIRVGGRRRRGREAGPGGLIIAGVIFTLVGSLITTVMGFVVLETIGTHRWQAVEATLEQSEVEVRDGGASLDQPFILTARYRYEVDGREFTGTRVRTSETTDSSYDKLALQRARLLAADPLLAYVDPADPAQAILIRDSLWMIFIIFFPLIFVVIGVLLVRHGLRLRRRLKAGPDGQPAAESLAASALAVKSKGGPWLGLAFCLVFLMAGVGVSFPLVILPWQESRNAANWTETPAEVIWSRVTSHRSDDGTTYGIDIFYRYEVDGVEHRSNRYDFIGGSSSGYQAKRAVVDRFPPGHEFVCYVDPDQPARAVILRDGSIGWWFLLPLAFVSFGAIGSLGFASTLIKRRLGGGANTGAGGRSPADRMLGTDPGRLAGIMGAAPAGASNPQADAGPPEMEFRAGANRRMKLIGSTVAAVFWNAIVGIFLVIAFTDSDGAPLVLFLFLIPFVLIGLVLIGAVFYTALGMFNPRTNLLLRPGHPHLGQSLVLRWRTFGSLNRLQDLTITIECREKASYSRGTNRITDEALIYRQTVATADQGLELREGRAELVLPEELVPTWEGANNRVEWQFVVSGEIKPGPDVKETHPVTVLPPPVP